MNLRTIALFIFSLLAFACTKTDVAPSKEPAEDPIVNRGLTVRMQVSDPFDTSLSGGFRSAIDSVPRMVNVIVNDKIVLDTIVRGPFQTHIPLGKESGNTEVYYRVECMFMPPPGDTTINMDKLRTVISVWPYAEMKSKQNAEFKEFMSTPATCTGIPKYHWFITKGMMTIATKHSDAYVANPIGK